MIKADTGVAACLVASVALLNGSSHAEESLMPNDTVYVGHGPSVMGMDMDKEEPADSGKTLTAHARRMKGPWSAAAFSDESPAHMVFLDSFLIDRYEVSNKDYGDFMKAQGHPAHAYWDDPRLNKPEQPVAGVNGTRPRPTVSIEASASRRKRNGKSRPWSERGSDEEDDMNSMMAYAVIFGLLIFWAVSVTARSSCAAIRRDSLGSRVSTEDRPPAGCYGSDLWPWGDSREEMKP